MTALALERLTPFAGSAPARGTYPIKANVRIFKGAMVGLDSAGRAMPANTIANGCLRIVGKASATYDNRTGSTLGGAAGAVDVEVEFGVFQFANSDSIAAADVGKACYAVDDQTVALSDSGNTRPFAGIITEVVSSKPYVFQGPHVVSSSSGSVDAPSLSLHSVRGASTANIANLAAFTVAGVDGLTYVAGERILLKNQTTGAENGIYTVGTVGSGTAPLTRALDANGAAEVVAGMLVHVSEGTVAADRFYFLSTNDPITLGTTALTFTQLPNAAQLASTASGAGASLIGVEDSAGKITATTAEGALAELAAILFPLTRVQFVTGTLVAGTATVTVGANQAVTALTKAFPIPSAVITGSTNFGCLAHLIASNVVGGSGVGQVIIRALANDGAQDADAAGTFHAILVD
jgi:hypothetical protein